MEIEIVSGSRILPMMNSFSAQMIPAYWRAIEFLSSNLASFPQEIHDNGAAIKKPHPLDKILRRKANPDQTSHAALKTWYYHGEHYGNGYMFIRRESPTSPVVVGLYNLMPVDVMPFRFLPENGSLFDAATYYWHAPSKAAFVAADVLHYRPQVSYDGLIGYSPSQMFQPTFARAQMLNSLARVV